MAIALVILFLLMLMGLLWPFVVYWKEQKKRKKPDWAVIEQLEKHLFDFVPESTIRAVRLEWVKKHPEWLKTHSMAELDKIPYEEPKV